MLPASLPRYTARGLAAVPAPPAAAVLTAFWHSATWRDIATGLEIALLAGALLLFGASR